jgi:catechol 2,3-dioxygenase-like lactoylglutathione lyase family enzyme
MRPQPLIAVTDVEASSRWYQRLLGCQSAHGGAEYERLVSTGALILQLHRFEVEHRHGPIGNPDDTHPAVGRRIARQVSRLLLSPSLPIDQPFWIDRRSCAESEGMRSVNIS